MHWIKISFCLYYHDAFLDTILMERAYGDFKAIYVNLTEKEEIYLYQYLKNPKHFQKKRIETNTLFDYLPGRFNDPTPPIWYNHRYELQNGEPWGRDFFYLNSDNETMFEIVDLQKINKKYFCKKIKAFGDW